MSSERNNPSTDRLPLVVYATVVCFVVWMAVAAWGFAGPGYADFALAVVTGLLFIAVAIPYVIWRVGRAVVDDRSNDRVRFSDWKSSQFEVWQGHQQGLAAAIEIILPIAAAAIGMTAFAIIFHCVAAQSLT